MTEIDKDCDLRGISSILLSIYGASPDGVGVDRLVDDGAENPVCREADKVWRRVEDLASYTEVL